MEQISLKEYLGILLAGTKNYIDTGTNSLNTSIEGYGTAMNTAINSLNELITTLTTTHSTDKKELEGKIGVNAGSIANHATEIANIKTDLNKKLDSDFVIPWATYDATNKIVKIGAPGSSFYIKSTTSGLEIYQGTTKITHWEGGHLKAVDITTSSSMTTPKITVGGLEISGNSTNGWSFR